MDNTCKVCQKPCKRTFCSQACSAIDRRSGRTCTCQHCGWSFYLRVTDEKNGGGKHCSEKCRRQQAAINSKNYLKIGHKTIHRIVAEKKIGRSLKKGETVHHIDGNILNNDPDNLMVLPNQTAHIKQEISEGKRTITHEFAVNMGKRSGDARILKSILK